MENKKNGSFYTPINLVKFMTSKININNKRILEPSFGDGRFFDYIESESSFVDGVENDESKVNNARLEYPKVNAIYNDFIDYALENNKKYDIIIGNPPYISKNNLDEKARNKSLQLLTKLGISSKVFQNLWVSFLLGAINLLNEEGCIFFVLPFEFLQVLYAEKLRGYLELIFNKIIIYTFEEKVFQNIEQEICLIFLEKQKFLTPFIEYITYDKIEKGEIIYKSKIQRNKPLKKWSNCIINDDEIEIINNLCNKYRTVKSYGNIFPGVVTGANDFFIVSKNDAIKYGLNTDILLPIIRKSSDVGSRIIFEKKDFDNLLNKNKKIFLINTNNLTETECSNMQYLNIGLEKGYHERYKCSIRNRWHDIPNIKRGELFFFKRYDLTPKLVLNDFNLYSTDIAYNIQLNEGIDKYSFLFCFYNSLTLLMCEYNGRYYGGGVSELVPSEFQKLPMPYKKIDKTDIDKLIDYIKREVEITVIIDYVDSIVLKEDMKLIKFLKSTRDKFIKRRKNTN